jgi:hypothetical protein
MVRDIDGISTQSDDNITVINPAAAGSIAPPKTGFTITPTSGLEENKLNTAPGAVVGILNPSGGTPSPSYVYNFVTGNSRFVISGTDLKVGVTALTAGSYEVTIRVGDSLGMSRETSATIVVAADTTPGIRYVKAGATGDGSSWANASGDLQAMIDEVDAAKVALIGGPDYIVRVAAGTYKPQHAADGASTDNRDKAFVLKTGVKILGGYDANPSADLSDTAREARFWTYTDYLDDPQYPKTRLPGTVKDPLHKTILSGDIDNNDSGFTITGNNARHVVIGADIDGTAVLDGFTIQGGNADGTGYLTVATKFIYQNRGGGIFNDSSSPTLINVTIAGNKATSAGGGIYNAASSSPALTKVTVAENEATNSGSGGGGIYNTGASSPILTGVVISKNKANNAGGIYNTGSSPVLTDVTISENEATSGYGGGIYNTGSSPVLTNVIISGNTAERGGGIYNAESKPVLTNVTIAGNTASTANVSGGGGGIFNEGSTSLLVLTNVTIAGNTASNSHGGGIVNSGGPSVLTNVIISGNRAAQYGGGIYNNESSLVMTNVTIAGNNGASSSGTGGIYNQSSTISPKIRNSIIWGNTKTSSNTPDNMYITVTADVFNSIIQGSAYPTFLPPVSGSNFNLNMDPVFGAYTAATTVTSQTGGDFTLQLGSPAIDIGNNADYPNETNTIFTGVDSTVKTTILAPALLKDLAGNTPRIKNGGTSLTIDMGAYEYHP